MREDNRWTRRIASRHPEFSPDDAEGFFSAWKHTGQVKYHQDSKALCELCGNPNLRYQFLVVHRQTGEVMWVGSECVLNFDLSEAAASARMRQIRSEKTAAARAERQQIQFSAMLEQLYPIYQGASRREQRRIRWIVGKCQHRGGFSPADLGWIYQAMLASGVNLDPELFPLFLSTKQDRSEWLELSISALRWFAPGLTAEQRAESERLGRSLDFEV